MDVTKDDMAMPQQAVSENPQKLNIEPMVLDKVKEIVEQQVREHVRHKHGAIIFVGSGGGKSTTYRNQVPNAEGKTDLIDADLLYRETNAHPCQPGVEPKRPLPWWDWGDEVIAEVEKRCDVVNQEMIDSGFWALTTSFTPDAAYVPDSVIIVLLPWEEHKRRIIEKSQGEHYDGGAKATDAGFSLVLGHRKWAEDVAKKKNTPVVNSIEAAINLIRSREAI